MTAMLAWLKNFFKVDTQKIIWKGSVNFTPGRKTWKPEIIVIHIMDGTLVGTDAWFNNEIARVSAHYGVGKSGEVHQYVKEEDTAWHAGRVYEPTAKCLHKTNGVYLNPNYYSIGIECEGRAADEWLPPLYNAVAGLCADICKRWDIPADREHIIGHREIYAVKSCPGKCDLDLLVRLIQDKMIIV